ncbi:endonuclease [Dysgonomonas sp. 216]|uniref:endonuclease/exonuclease/phosphatase family protein n=1 Tax=Dysgonomonas sp. 216 TaxID=2302934 RepID=UPI0013D807A4|nr:endonuclease/exonuclease/phosphatase family protein [Dysgonomonas sp. 216]NDW17932.1 endonuclease [Dysgonomonas sp. 216]
MQKLLLSILLILYLVSCKLEKNTEIKVATFNIRYENSDDAPNTWDNRVKHVCKFIKENNLSVIGFQEVLFSQLQDMKENLPQYEFIGVGRDDGKTKGEYASIAFLKDSFEKIDDNTFWLAENPDSIGVLGWDAKCTRIATWVKLKDKENGKIFMLVNTHFDHIGTEARKNSALLIINKIKEIVGNNPALLTGDFNVTDDSDAYRTITTNNFILKDAHKIAAEITGSEYTYHNFGKNQENERTKIDFIFVTPNITVFKSEIPHTQIDSVLYLSDHNPQIVNVAF